MQFSKLAAVFAIAATASAVAIETRGGGGTVCKKDGKCKPEDPDKCSSEGGEAFKCETIGLVNALNCISLLNGNTIDLSIPIDLSIL